MHIESGLRCTLWTTNKTIQVLRGLFSRYGILPVLVSDNGPQFCSEEFSAFLKSNGVKHIHSAMYHPATNGLAERFLQTFKHALKPVSYKVSVEAQGGVQAIWKRHVDQMLARSKETHQGTAGSRQLLCVTPT